MTAKRSAGDDALHLHRLHRARDRGGTAGFAAKVHRAGRQARLDPRRQGQLPAGRGRQHQVLLAHPETVDKLCHPLDTDGEVSCCQGTKVVINVKRWRTASHWTGR